MAVADVFDMEFAANAFSGRLIERLVAHSKSRGTRRIAGIAVSHQQRILVHDRREDLP